MVLHFKQSMFEKKEVREPSLLADTIEQVRASVYVCSVCVQRVRETELFQ